ncbi:hypothetical protein HELRODRAFT_175368 [Helobdella robusta]|uniref:Hemerythrin-like domain-containing protein n=1 Tax=Helobdella robusta TaxID=6412 RepID=T1F971_HELRO|nr:hypothetical protein HELRODRAFT_175368 [Helobdella robusta]ESO00871.1 hypothetical protein HELRODRAFT_175368 [Helobdella robusta]
MSVRILLMMYISPLVMADQESYSWKSEYKIDVCIECIVSFPLVIVSRSHKVTDYTYEQICSNRYPKLDDQHQQVFSEVDKLSENTGDEAQIKYTISIYKMHFDYEESQMRKANYENYDDHKLLHESFLEEFRNHPIPISIPNMEKIKSWLIAHIKTYDRKFNGKM